MNDHHTEFDINAGALCLSFANAFNITASEKHEEMIKEYADLIKWGQTLEVIDVTTAQSLLHQANQHPDEAATVLQSAWTLRKSIFGIFAAIAHHKSPDPADLNALNAALPGALTHQLIEKHEDGFTWKWDDATALDQMIWPVIHDAANLLTGDSLNRVGQCANVSRCGWLFLDTSRSGKRRWCSMETCGNRAKARRYYQRANE